MDREKLTQKQIEALRHIRNWLVHKGTMPSVRELMAALGYRSPRSAALIIEELIDKGFLKRKSNRDLQLIKNLPAGSLNIRTTNIPLIGTVACGPAILAEENIEGFVPVSVTLASPGLKYFLLRASGDSMNEVGINDGDLVFVRQQPTAEEGEIVVALIDDEATVKEFHRGKGIAILKPRSTNKDYQPIILTDDFQIQGIVVATIPNWED